MKVLIAILLAVVACASAQQIWTSCGQPSDTLTVTNLRLVPSPPVIGQTLTVTLNGTLKTTITDGHIAVLVFYNGIQLFSETFDICTSFSGVFSCPVNAGPFNARVSQAIPAFAPPGEYSGQLTLHDQSGAEVTCVKFDFNMATNSVPTVQMALDNDMIAQINNDPTSTWVAGRNDKFEGLTLEQAKKFLGTNLVPIKNAKKVVTHADAIPTSFDSRQHWPHCIHPIRNQEKCGSCWAFGATEALSDRFCIASNGKVSPVLSPQYLVSCDDTNYGCQGGYLEAAWEFMENHGVVNDSCFPYASASGTAPKCISRCVDGESMKFYKVKKGSIQQPYDVESMQTLIMTSGPVEAAFSVYQDFFNYKSGVYTHKTGTLAGGHAIKIVGWGVDSASKQPYWIVANSWGTSWGINGFFWILRGADECGIEDNVIAGAPQL